MPRLWTETVDAHPHAVRDAVLDSAWALVTEHGALSVTMSQIAQRSGIGRATLYKYFPDVEAILRAHHERHVLAHLEQLAALRDGPGDVDVRLEAVLQRYARICHHRGRHAGTELGALLPRGAHVVRAEHQVVDLFADLLGEAAAAGTVADVRTTPGPRELAAYCVHALDAAADLPDEAAVRRLVAVIRDGLRR